MIENNISYHVYVFRRKTGELEILSKHCRYTNGG